MSTPGIQTVLVPLDGSERAEQALPPAVQLAERMDADLVLMTTAWEGKSIETVRRYLDVHIALLERDVEPLVVLDREAPDAILFAAREPGTLVCMTTHGRGGVVSAVLGSVAEAVVRGASGPVVLMGPGMKSDWVLPRRRPCSPDSTRSSPRARASAPPAISPPRRSACSCGRDRASSRHRPRLAIPGRARRRAGGGGG